jgi:Cytochrome c554 and c-prime
LLSCILLLLCAGVSLSQSARSPQPPNPKQREQQQSVEIPLATAARVERAKNSWWPTKIAQSRQDFLGNQACANCHAQKTSSQFTTPMAQAAGTASEAKILREHPSLTAKRGVFTYSISQTPEAYSYSVSDGTNQLSATILWAFGLGNKGQTYLYQRHGQFHESEMSYYPAFGGLDVTTGHEHNHPETLEDALGMPQDRTTAGKCFGCHTTGATTVGGGFAPQSATPGVTCEACHGPGGAHVVLMQQLQGEAAASPGTLEILNPRSLSPIASVDFCGACHRTWTDVYEMQSGASGPVNARFQPYRLENSKCWGEGDARLVCTACHDPHQPLQHDAAAYDSKCLACHPAARSKTAAPTTGPLAAASAASRASPIPKACPVATEKCVTCHMPKINVPVMHSDFTDHRIRIVRKGEPYPD